MRSFSSDIGLAPNSGHPRRSLQFARLAAEATRGQKRLLGAAAIAARKFVAQGLRKCAPFVPMKRRIRVNKIERMIAVTMGKKIRTFPFGVSYLMSPGRNDSPGGTVPIGFSLAFAEAILMSPERSAHPALASGILVSARRSRSASQSIRARASTTTMKILRNEYINWLAQANHREVGWR